MDNGILSKPIIPIIFLSVGIIIYLSQYVTFKSNKKIILEKRTQKRRSGFLNILYNWVFKRLENKGWYQKKVDTIQFNLGYFSSDSDQKNRLKAERYVINSIFKTIAEIIFILVVFKTTMPVKILLILLLNIIKIYLYRNHITIKKNKLRNEFPLLVKEFITNYVDKLNVTEAFKLSTHNMSPVYQVHLNRLISQLNSGTGVEESLMNFDDRIDYVMCSSFIAIVKSAFSSNTNVITNLLELESLIAQERADSKKFKDKLQEKKSNIYFLSICIFCEIVFIGDYTATTTGNFFITTLDGQALLLASIVAITLSILTIIYVEII